MSMITTCTTTLVSDIERFWSFLKSTEGQTLLLSLAGAKALFLYLLRHPLREARELAHAMVVMALILLAVASEMYPPGGRTQSKAECKGFGTDLAASKPADGVPRRSLVAP